MLGIIKLANGSHAKYAASGIGHTRKDVMIHDDIEAKNAAKAFIAEMGEGLKANELDLLHHAFLVGWYRRGSYEIDRRKNENTTKCL